MAYRIEDKCEDSCEFVPSKDEEDDVDDGHIQPHMEGVPACRGRRLENRITGKIKCIIISLLRFVKVWFLSDKKKESEDYLNDEWIQLLFILQFDLLFQFSFCSKWHPLKKSVIMLAKINIVRYRFRINFEEANDLH